MINAKETLPDLSATKGLPFFFGLLIKSIDRLTYGHLTMVLPTGQQIYLTSGNAQEDHATMIIKDYAMGWRSLTGGTIGLYESYADEQWSSPDLSQTLFVLAKNVDAIRSIVRGNFFIRQINRIPHLANKNTKQGSRRNIMAHYDLGNEFYEKWLDRSMTYSSALYTSREQRLSDAQQAKYRSLAEQINLQPGDHVLEIGSGWGGFAEFAAKNYKAKVTGLTISPEQHAYARQRMQDAGVNEQVDIRLQDYRDVEGRFDKIASIEMFEAVGREYWPIYFNKIRSTLKAGGRAGLQIITIADNLYPQYERGVDFIQRYVFPGGMLPSPQRLSQEVNQAGLTIAEVKSFGRDYATTLKHWHKRFLNNWSELKPLGFDRKFKSLWRFYLAYCEAGFKAGTTDVAQYGLIKR